MPPLETAYKEIEERIKDGLQDQYGDLFNAYFDGDPAEIGLSMLPAICVVGGKIRIRQSATGMDEVTKIVVVKLVLSKIDDLGADTTVDLTEKKLRNYTTARASDNTWDEGAMSSFLRTQLTLGNAVIENDMDIDPVTALRPVNRGNGVPVPTSEVHITLQVKYRVFVTART